jgi:cobalt/nickel transport system ATP-binding protein
MSDDTALQLSDLRFTYPDGVQALSGVSFAVTQGERVALLGPNGSGKSTLMLHLNGILTGEGAVTVFGTRLERSTLKDVRRAVGLVFQNPDDQLFCPTVFEDVAFGPRNMGLRGEDLHSRVRESLAAVSMSGYEERSAFHLSFGEKKRIAIATVLAMRPRLLVLDEPTANLDPRGRREILQLLIELGGTQIIATHDLHFAERLCTRAVILHRGVIVAEGACGEIIHNAALLDAHGLS